MDWKAYEQVMKPVRNNAKKPISLQKKKEAPYKNKDLFKKIVGS